MRFLPTRIHGVIDYLYSLAFLASPWLLGYGRGGAETWLAVAMGAGGILYSLLTDYELGAIRVLSMRTHLVIDLALGLLLLASPWLFDLPEEARPVYLGFGLFAVVASAITRTRRSGQTVPAARTPAGVRPVRQ